VKSLVSIIAWAVLGGTLTAAAQYDNGIRDIEPEKMTDRALFQAVCTQCHAIEGYIYERSFKAWQLTVDRMRNYAYGDQSFSEEVAERIVGFLHKSWKNADSDPRLASSWERSLADEND